MSGRYMYELDQVKFDYNQMIARLRRNMFYSYALMALSAILGVFLIGVLDILFIGRITLLVFTFFYFIGMMYLADIISQQPETRYRRMFIAITLFAFVLGYQNGAAIEFPLIVYTLSVLYLENLTITANRVNRVESDWFSYIDQLINETYGRNLVDYVNDRIRWNQVTIGFTGFGFVIFYSITSILTDGLISNLIETIALLAFMILIVPILFRIPKKSKEFDLKESKQEKIKDTMLGN